MSWCPSFIANLAIKDYGKDLDAVDAALYAIAKGELILLLEYHIVGSGFFQSSHTMKERKNNNKKRPRYSEFLCISGGSPTV